MTSFGRSRYSALAALFAMCILFVGPLLSQALARAHATAAGGHGHAVAHYQPLTTPDLTVGHQHDGAHGHGGARVEATASSSSAAHEHAIWAKCGYCDLLLMCPAIGVQGYSIAGSLPVGPVQSNFGPVRNDALSPIFPGARSRAPPALV